MLLASAGAALAAPPEHRNLFVVSDSVTVDCGAFDATINFAETRRSIRLTDSDGNLTEVKRFVSAPDDTWVNLTTGNTILVRGKFRSDLGRGHGHRDDHLRPGDELVIWKLDQLGHSTKKLLQFIELLDTKGVTFRSLTEGITTTGPNGKAMLTILTALARLERDTTTERTKAGMAFAAAHGRQGGRPAITAENAAVKRTHELKALGLKPANIGKVTGLSRATIYRYLNIGREGRA